MTTWAKDSGGTLQYPTAEEFRGIPHYETNEPACRKRGYMPLEGEPEPREGYTAEPQIWHTEHREITRIEPRQVIVEDWETDPETGERRKVGEHTEMQDTEITLDKSAICVDSWEYVEIPIPPEPDTSERDNAEKAIVGRIAALALKYDALSDLAGLEITIPNLLALAAEKGVTDADLQAVKSDVAILVLDLMAKEGGDWAGCWEGLKSRFVQWMEEINSRLGAES